MSSIKVLSKDGDLDQEDKEIMVEGMLAHHAKSGHPRETSTFSVVLKDDNDKTVGAAVATFLWNGMEINSLWVDESLRGQGLGRKLMEALEEEGRKRGCTVSYTNTFPWQAPEFYEKLGYELYGRLDDLPKGSHLSYYKKIL